MSLVLVKNTNNERGTVLMILVTDPAFSYKVTSHPKRKTCNNEGAFYRSKYTTINRFDKEKYHESQPFWFLDSNFFYIFLAIV